MDKNFPLNFIESVSLLANRYQDACGVLCSYKCNCKDEVAEAENRIHMEVHKMEQENQQLRAEVGKFKRERDAWKQEAINFHCTWRKCTAKESEKIIQEYIDMTLADGKCVE